MAENSQTTHWVSNYIETILLKVISVGDCYGYDLSKTIAKITNGVCEIKEATLYSGLRRLEAENRIASYWGEESLGGRRKYYTITHRGREFLAENRQKWESTVYLLNRILHWEGFV